MEGNGMSRATFAQETINCLYRNRTEKMAILKIDFMGQWLERVVEAGKDFPFKAPEGAYLDICTYEMATMILQDRVPCRELAVQGGIFFD
jgi:hypothetical protein